MSVDYGVYIGAMLRVVVRPIEESDIGKVFNCGHYSTSYNVYNFCPICGTRADEKVTAINRYPSADIFWGENEEYGDDGITMHQADGRGRTDYDACYLFDQRNDGVCGFSFDGSTAAGYMSIDLSPEQYIANFEQEHREQIAYIKSLDCVVSTEIIYGVFRYYW